MARKRSTRFAFLALPIFLLTACQPTPNKELVVNRLDGDLEAAIIAEAAEPYRYEAPERWTETMNVRGRTVRIDAEVVVPDAERFPVLTITRDWFDAQRCIDILTMAFGEAKDLRENEYSYEEAFADLQVALRGHYYVRDEEKGWGPYDGQEEDIARLQSILAELDPEDTYIPLTAANLEIPISGRVIRLANGEPVYLWGYTNQIGIQKHRDLLFQLEQWVMEGEATPGEAAHKLENIIISEEDAVKEGNAVVAALDCPDFRLASAERARAIEDRSHKVHGEGYLLTYVSCAEGACPVVYQSRLGHRELPFSEAQDAYVAAWTQERVRMLVTEEGLLYFDWIAPKTVVNTANENAVLLPFAEIQERIRNLLSVGLYVDEQSIDDDAVISRIVLGASIQQTPNQGDEAFLVPTWVITFTTESEQRAQCAPSVFILNALDGFSVSRWVDPEEWG